jgi:tetratricopeptide (TPR) repeat protein
MGFFAAYAGSLDLAYQYLQAAQSRWDDLEEPPLIAYVMLNIAEVARLDGRPEAIHAGLEQASQGIETLRKFQDRPDWSNYLKLADLHMALSEEDPAHAFEALVAIEKALEVIEEFPEIWLPPEYLYFTASKVLRTNKRLDEADDYLRQAYERVMLVAGNIKDDDLRRSYLKNVPVNRDIVAETNARGMVT